MASKVLFLVFSVLLISEAISGEFECDKGPFGKCERPKVFEELPRDVSEFNQHCQEAKSYLRCLKAYHDECGTDRIVLFRTNELYDATYNTMSDLCEEGTLLNSVALENLKCFSDTFSSTKCRGEAEEVTEPLVEEYREAIRDNPDFDEENSVDYFCLQETLTHGCVLREASQNCGKLVEEATLEFMNRAQTLEYVCTAKSAKSVLDELDSFKLNEDQRSAVTSFLEKIVERDSD